VNASRFAPANTAPRPFWGSFTPRFLVSLFERSVDNHTARIGRPSVVASASRRARFRSFKNGGIIADKMTTRLARS
jgi:hypothetical protein